MAERFMFIPSLGFCIVLTFSLVRLTKTESLPDRFTSVIGLLAFHKRAFFIVLAICTLYYFKTVSRNEDWKDNLALFSHDVVTSGNSARTNQTYGSALMLSAMKSTTSQNRLDTFNLAKQYLKKASEIYPEFYVPLSHLGVIYLFENKFDSAYDCFSKGIKIMPDDVDVNFNLGLTLFHLKKNDEAIKVFQHTIQLAPKHEEAYYNLAALYQNTGDYDKAISNYSKVIELNPKNANAYYNCGEILKSKNDTAKANEYINKAVSLGYKLN
jgi:tetratricopeptide (TPR) repeat protein